jgi:uncharacterized membrane protein
MSPLLQLLPPRERLRLAPPVSPATWLVIAFLVLSFIGFVDASYLSIETLSGRVPPCIVGGGCATVTLSSYSKILGIPVPLLGALYYLTIFIGTAVYLDRRSLKVFGGVTLLTVCGFLMSSWFLFVQAVLLEAYCMYCLISAFTSYTLFGLALYYRFKTS